MVPGTSHSVHLEPRPWRLELSNHSKRSRLRSTSGRSTFTSLLVLSLSHRGQNKLVFPRTGNLYQAFSHSFAMHLGMVPSHVYVARKKFLVGIVGLKNPIGDPLNIVSSSQSKNFNLSVMSYIISPVKFEPESSSSQLYIFTLFVKLYRKAIHCTLW